MPVKPSLPEQQIIDCLSAHYGLEVIQLTLLPLGADLDASVYKAVSQDQSSYFVKLKRGQHQGLDIAIVQLIHEVGIQQVIPPLKTIHGDPTQNLDDFTLIIYPFIEGQDGFSRDLTDEQWQTLGKTLRQIQEISLPSSIKQRLRQETYAPKWREIVRALYPLLETKPNGDPIALQLWAFMKKNIQTIQRLVDRAEQLAQVLRHETAPFVLCHSDIHGGNVLLTDRNTLYIVDWDDPIMAPKERDLMFIGGGVANVWNKAQEEALFYKGYGTIEVNRTILAYYRHERIVEDIAIYGQDLLLSMEGGEGRAELYKHFTEMFTPRGVIDIAFKTDNEQP